MPYYRGMLHVHSTLSDGAYSPSDLRERARNAGLSFVILCEHTWRLGVNKRLQALRICQELSDDGFLCMLGLECGHQGRHVLLLGPPDLICRVEAPEVVLEPAAMRAAGGMTIWAHPAATAYPSLRPGILADYDGWEIWNHYVDGPVPSLPILAMLSAQRARGRSVVGLASADFHDERRHRILPTLGLDVPALGARLVLNRLREGQFDVLSSDGSRLMNGCAEGPYTPTPGARAYALSRYGLLRLRSCAVWLWRALRRRVHAHPNCA
ncbi:MAG: hypothetical protein KBI47_16440 [Armatimonadetes bacterium]|nr:hypothetical protein [Armatimonadota bacterium]MDI9582608.1 hypothetical protein [Acidobacteriota bacterium]